MTVGLIWAQARARVVGRDNSIPWRIPEDMAHFRAVTAGAAVLMGRRTWHSLPSRFRPLPDRRNVVLTRDPTWTADGAEVRHDLDAALGELSAAGDVWVLGGATVWTAALPLADQAFITEVDLVVDGGDTYAPLLGDGWTCDQRGPAQHSNTGLDFRIDHYVRTDATAG